MKKKIAQVSYRYFTDTDHLIFLVHLYCITCIIHAPVLLFFSIYNSMIALLIILYVSTYHFDVTLQVYLYNELIFNFVKGVLDRET